MNKITLLSLVAVSVLFTACGDEVKDLAGKAVEATKDVAKEAANAAVDTAKEAANTAVDSAKDAASNAVESTKEAVTATAAKAVDTAKETVAPADAAPAASNEKGKALYAKCQGCHGADGKTLAMGKSAKVAGQSVEALVEAMNGYKAGTRNVAGMGMIMKGQAVSMSDEDIKAVSEYMSGL